MGNAISTDELKPSGNRRVLRSICGMTHGRQVARVALSCCLVLGLAPVTALAADGGGGNSTQSSQSGGTPPDMPSGSSQQGGGSGGGGGANTQSFDYSGTYTGALSADGTTVTSTGKTVDATDTDQNAALAQNGGTLTIDGDTLTKAGDDTNGDNCNFYGLNSILLAVGSGSMAYVANTALSATSEGSNGIFATDSGTVYANNDTINTTAGNSRGLDATYDGTIVANLMDMTTQGDHCATVATDRGGGNVSLTNSTLSTAGSGSPLLYSTGDIEVDGCTGTATGSQIAGMEGLNTILIYNSTLTSTITGKTASDPVADGVIIYQSTSGDAESTTGEAATFEVSDSTLSSAITSGAMFYVTNTTANIVLSNSTLDFDSSAVNLLSIAGNDANSWGTAGSNGGTVTFTGLGQTLDGNISVDTISSLGLYLLEGTTWTGAASIEDNSAATSTTGSPITVNVDADSSWVVTGDSTVSNLNVASGGKVVDASGNTVTIVANGETVVSGTSSYTVTVTGSYSTTVSTDSTNQLSSANIDRTAFDEYYGTSTTFGSATQQTVTTTSQTAPVATDTTDTADETTADVPWWEAAWNAIVSFFTGN